MIDQGEIDGVEEKKGRSRLVLVAGLVVVIVLVAVAVAGFFIIRGNEEKYLADGKAAIEAGDWEGAVEVLGQAIDTQPAFLRQHVIEAQSLRGLAHYQLGSYEIALADFDAALAGNSDLLDVAAYRGDILYQQGDSEGALESFAVALENEELLPDHLQALVHTDQAATYYGRSDNDRGKQEAKAAILVDSFVPEENLASLYAAGTQGNYQAGDMEGTLSNGLAALSFEDALGAANQAKVLATMALAYYQEDQLDLALESVTTALELGGLDEEQQASLHTMQANALFREGKLEEAISAAQEAVDNGQGEAQLHGLQAVRAYKTGEWDQAIEEAEAALALDEENALAHWVRGTVYLWQGYHEKALAEFDKAIELDGNDVEALAMRVYAWLEDNNLEAAEEDLAQAQAANPAAPATLFAEAQIDYYNANLEKARVLMDKAIELDDGRPEFYALRALTNDTFAELDFHQADLESALNLDDDFPMARLIVIQDKGMQYDYTGIRSDIDEVMALYPELTAVYEQMVNYYLYVEDDAGKALEYAEKILTLASEDPDSYVTRGYCYLYSDDFDSARADFEMALEKEPDSLAPVYGLAIMKWTQGEYQEALALFDQVLAGAPNSASSLFSQAWIHLELGENETAWQKVHKALAIDPDYPEALRLRAIMYLDSGMVDRAERDITRALEVYPLYPDAHLTQAWIYSEQGQADDARESAKRALELDDSFLDVYSLLIDAAWNEDNNEEIESLARQWLESDPESKEARYWLSEGLSMQAKSQEALDSLETLFEMVRDDDLWLADFYYLRAMTYLDLGDDTAYTTDLKAALDVATNMDFIDQVEVMLARPQVQHIGERTVINDSEAGFTISLGQEWYYYPAEPEEGYYLSLGYGEEFLLASVDVYVIDWDPTSSLYALAEAIEYDGEGVKTSGPDPLTIGGESGLVQHFEYEDEFGDVLLGHQYIVPGGDRVAIIEVWADEDVIEEFEIEFETMIDSFDFLP